MIKILQLEDDKNECEKLKFATLEDLDCEFICQTNSISEALKQYELRAPDVCIVDLELNGAECIGSGFDFLTEISKKKKSIIIVTSNINSEYIIRALHKEYKIDRFICKSNADYTPTTIMKSIKFCLYGKELEPNKLNEKDKERLEKFTKEEKRKYEMEVVAPELINEELRNLGMRDKLIGTKYIKEALLYVICNGGDKRDIFKIIASKNNIKSSGIARGMQVAINDTWDTHTLDHLQRYFKTNYSYKRGAPTPSEFLAYYYKVLMDQLDI